MNLSAMKSLVTSKIARRVLVTQKHAPAILFAAGVVGVIGTVVVACRATMKLEDILLEHDEMAYKINSVEALEINQDEYSDDDRKRDMVILYARTVGKIAKAYGPAVVLGVLSISALTGSHIVLTRRNVALTAAYAALEKGFRDYRDRVVKELGPEKDRQFRYNIEEYDVIETNDEGDQVVKTVRKANLSKDGSIYARLFDETNPNWERGGYHNQFFIQCQQNFANDKLNSQGHLFLNEVYDMLHMSRSEAGAIVGWLKESEGAGYVDFGVFEGDRESGQRFVNGDEHSVWLDFNVDGIIYNKI